MVIAAAILALAGFQPPQDDPVPPLVGRLRSERVEDRDRAVQELRGLGPEVAASLKSALRQEGDPEVRARLEGILRSFWADRICEGSTPLLSPDGARLAFQRWRRDPTAFDLRGNQVYRSETWVRDLKDGKERCLAEQTRQVAWRDEKTLMLASGDLVDGETGKVVGPLAKFPHDVRMKATRWSRDGRQLVCIPDAVLYRINPNLKPSTDAGGILYWLDESGAGKKLPLGHDINTDGSGFLSWSPDSKRLAFDLLFFRKGNVPLRRIGVLEFATGKVSYVGESEYCHYNWGHLANEGSGTAQHLWDGAGQQFAFVTGRGNGEGEISVSSADGSRVVRVTEDGQCKWSPVLDPAGRRLAFAAAKWGGENGTLLEGHLRVLDLLTGEEERFKPEPAGHCGTLTWSSDGKSLFYDWGNSIYRALLRSPRAMPKGSPIVARTVMSRKQEVIKALGSDNSAVVAWGAEAAREFKDGDVFAALKSALGNSLKAGHTTAIREILYGLGATDARAALPEVLQAIDFKDDWTRCIAIGVLARWKAEASVEPLAGVIRNSPDTRAAGYAAWALAGMGRESGWDTLRAYATSPNRQVRGDLASNLAGLRDRRSVDILIRMVEDRERLYWDYTGEVQVGDHAEDALAQLTGETFGRDRLNWTAWWEGRQGRLPELKGANRAVDTLRSEKERRAEQRQKELREGKK